MNKTKAALPVLSPERQIDERIARELFGGPTENVDWWWWSTAEYPIGAYQTVPDGGEAILYGGPYFSTEIAAAWRVVDVLAASWTFSLSQTDDCRWGCSVGGESFVEGTAPLAICQAALHFAGNFA